LIFAVLVVKFFLTIILVTVAERSLVSKTRVRARYVDKSNGDGVETENSLTLGEIRVAVSGPDKATSGLVKQLPVERTTSGVTETANTAA